MDAKIFDQLFPKTHEAWIEAREKCLKAENLFWANVVTSRYLEVEPNDAEARIWHVKYVQQMTENEEIYSQIDRLSSTVVTDPLQRISVVIALANFGKKPLAKKFLDQAISDCQHTSEFLLQVARAFIVLEEPAKARKKLRDICKSEEASTSLRLTALTLANTLNDGAFVRKLVFLWEKTIPASDYFHRIWLANIAGQVGDLLMLEKIASAIDFQAVTPSIAVLELLEAVEGRGLFDIEDNIIKAFQKSRETDPIFIKKANELLEARKSFDALPYAGIKALYQTNQAGAPRWKKALTRVWNVVSW